MEVVEILEATEVTTEVVDEATVDTEVDVMLQFKNPNKFLPKWKLWIPLMIVGNCICAN